MTTNKTVFDDLTKKKVCEWVNIDAAYFEDEPDCVPIWYRDYGNINVEIPSHGIARSTLRYLASLVSVINGNPLRMVDIKSDKEACEILDREIPSLDWFLSQLEYIAQMKRAVAEAFHSYSYQGDQFINDYLRGELELGFYDGFPEPTEDSFVLNLGNLIEEQLTESDLNKKGILAVAKYGGFKNYMSRTQQAEDAWENVADHIDKTFWHKASFKRAFDRTVSIMNQVIMNAPPVDKDIIVYRGVKSAEHLKEEGVVDIKGFLSTTLDYMVALEFARSNGPNTTIIVIKVPVGTPCLLMTSWNPNESEILFPLGVQLHVENHFDTIDTIDIRGLYNCSVARKINLSIYVTSLSLTDITTNKRPIRKLPRMPRRKTLLES